MIETDKKYKLKKTKGFDNSDNEYYKVIGFYNFDTVICKNSFGERFVFMKKFLIDPQKPDDIYSNLILERKGQVDKQGKRYNIELDNIRGFEDDFEK